MQPRKPKPIIIYIIIDHNSAHRNHLNVIMSLSLMSLIKYSAQHLVLSTKLRIFAAELSRYLRNSIMTEFYISRLYAISFAVILLMGALVYWCLCYHLIPINEPNVSAAFSHFVEAVLLFGAVVMVFVVYYSFSLFRLFIRRTPIVIITNDQLQVYDFAYNRYRMFDWKDVVKIEKTSDRSHIYFDVYVRNEERYQIIETTRWRRFMQRLNNSLLQGAAVRISPTILNISNRELLNMLQSHISK